MPLWKWSLGAYIAIMLSHERRHVWQGATGPKRTRFPWSALRSKKRAALFSRAALTVLSTLKRLNFCL
jgi:hypothetical protein